jgi:molybdopterin converting factor subunit 1
MQVVEDHKGDPVAASVLACASGSHAGLHAAGTMHVTVLYFARSREVAGTSSQVFQLPDGSTTQDLLQHILQQLPSLKGVLDTCVFAVNQQYVQLTECQQLRDQDEVAIIPPLSGG